MLEKLRLETLTPLVGSKLRLSRTDGPDLELAIHEVTALPRHDEQARAPFSVLFHGPATPMLEQAIYSVEHAELGTMELFLVPLGPKGDAVEYEAVFT